MHSKQATTSQELAEMVMKSTGVKFSARLINPLFHAGNITTLTQIKNLSKDDALKIPNMGPVMIGVLEEVQEALRSTESSTTLPEKSSRELATELAEQVKVIEQAIDKVVELGKVAVHRADFNFVVDFDRAKGAGLQETGALLHLFVKNSSTVLQNLGNILYLKETETIRTPVKWREAADVGQRIEAIKLVLKYLPTLSLKEATTLVDTYLVTPF